MAANLIRIYIFDGYRDTVIESQVFNWSQALYNAGLKTIGLSITDKHIYDQKNDLKLKQLSEKYNIEVYNFQYYNYLFIREMQIVLSIFKLWFKIHKNYDKIVVQTRLLGQIYIVPFCRWLLGIKFIFDVRGSVLTEYLFQAKPKSGFFNRERILRRLESKVVSQSDAVFCVSEVLKDYLIGNYGYEGLHPDKITVIPGAADNKFFFYSEQLRAEIRKQLHCEDKTVFIYTGRLNKQWQIPEKVFELLGLINKKFEQVYFVILTPDFEIAHRLCLENSILKERYFASYVSMDEINPYLNAADCAIALRENIPVNHHASPTKIAEYLLTGISIVISSNIGDFSGYVAEHDFGYAVDIEDNEYPESVIRYLKQSIFSNLAEKENRVGKSELAAKVYAKDKYVDLIYQKCLEI